MVDKDETWRQKIRFQQSPLFCCSEHFVETGDRKSLTGARRDLEMPFLPFLHGQIVTMKYVRGLREQESAGTKRLSHSKEKQRKREI